MVFASNRKGIFDLYEKPANGSASAEVLLKSADSKRPNSWSPDGRFIRYKSDQNYGDLMVLPLTGDRKPFQFFSTPFDGQDGAFSPDGKWWLTSRTNQASLRFMCGHFQGQAGSGRYLREAGTLRRAAGRMARNSAVQRPQFDVARDGWFLINTEVADTAAESHSPAAELETAGEVV